MKGKIVKTRKEHECTRCHSIIPKGVEAFQALGEWRRFNKETYLGYIKRKYYCMQCLLENYWISKDKDKYGCSKATYDPSIKKVIREILSNEKSVEQIAKEYGFTIEEVNEIKDRLPKMLVYAI